MSQVASAAIASPAAQTTPGPRRAGVHHVELGGWLRAPLRLGPDTLESFAAITVPDFHVVCALDGAHGRPRPLRGVPLRTLVCAAEPAFVQRTDFKRVALVAESREGYRALFSWNELFNSMLGDGVLLAWACAQAPLAADSGPFVLVSLHDHGYVQRLASIELHKLW